MEEQSHTNGGSVKVNGSEDEYVTKVKLVKEEETLYTVLHHMVASILFPDDTDNRLGSASLPRRIAISLSDKAPIIQEASRNTGRNVIIWTRKGSPLRALLVISVGTITLLALTGLLVFMLFFAVATINAIIVSLLMSLAAAGGFLAIFFSCLTAIYIGALCVAVFVISTATILTVIGVVVATAWIGFIWMVWLAIKKSFGLARHSVSIPSSVLSTYSSAPHADSSDKPERVLE